MITQTAFMGSLPDLAAALADHLAMSIAERTRIEPPMGLKQAADFMEVSTRHLEELVNTTNIPWQNVAAPGAKRRIMRFYRHELAAWKGTEGLAGVAEVRVNLENGRRG